MNVLDSRLEALAFNYVSFGIFTVVNNLWTWIAVVTAAVSFWRIRVAVGVLPAEGSPPRDDRSSCRSAPEIPPGNQAPVASPPLEKKPPSPARCVEEVRKTTGSMKFAMYYYYDNDTDGGVTETEMAESDGGPMVTESDGEEWWGSWERVLRTRKGLGESETAGWYRYQDLTELNGNVVRLWDGRDCIGEESHYCFSKRCVLW